MLKNAKECWKMLENVKKCLKNFRNVKKGQILRNVKKC